MRMACNAALCAARQAASDWASNEQQGKPKAFRGLDVSMRIVNMASQPIRIYNGTEPYRMLHAGGHSATLMAPHLSEWSVETKGIAGESKWTIDFVNGVYQEVYVQADGKVSVGGQVHEADQSGVAVSSSAAARSKAEEASKQAESCAEDAG